MSKTASKQSAEAVVKVVPSISEIAEDAWDACANPDPATYNPFLSHAFLAALEESKCVGGRTGWLPQHLLIEDEQGVAGVAAAYVKGHSQGEYVFDYGWADAYERAGGDYYPKLQLAVPFTPVPGRRLLARPGPGMLEREALLAHGAVALASQHRLSSAHVTFLTEGEWSRLGGLGFLLRDGKQYHWTNAGYGCYDDFLSTLASRKRKALRKERRLAPAAGIEISWVEGQAITESLWDTFYAFYMDTGSRKWGRPYLNRRFFSLLGEKLADDCLLVLAKRNGRIIAGALNLVGGDCLYGRYWGAQEHHAQLHFEVCYHQAIDYAIEHKLARVEAGAQGDHKLARGYMPVATYSAHWIADRGFRRAVQRFLDEERQHMACVRSALAELGPFRKEQLRSEEDE